MSAYGNIAVISRPLLPPTSWDLPQPQPGKPVAPFRRLALHHLRLNSARAVPGLLEYAHRVFTDEIEAGRTYPQEPDIDVVAAVPVPGAEEDSSSSPANLSNDDLSATAADDRDEIGIEIGTAAVKDSDNLADTNTDTDKASSLSRRCRAYSRAAFETYFWAADVIIAVGLAWDVQRQGFQEAGGDPEASRAGRSWEDALVGLYYVKPNYPGRSSHICNAGFMIPPAQRQFGYGMTLGKSYLHYGPSLGYKASVFNLVYANNTGSLRIWDSLGFIRAGLIPCAGRLRRADGKGEEWVDAIIYYRSFVDEDEWARPIE